MKIFENTTALTASHLTAGQFVETKGYTSKGDGGGARYLIKTSAEATADGDTIDEQGAGFTLANGNVAVLQSDHNLRRFGATGDGTGTGDEAAKDAYLAWLTAKGGGVFYAPAGHYIFNDFVVNGPNRISVIGEQEGVIHNAAAAINDTNGEATIFQQAAGQAGLFFDYSSPDDTTLNTGGPIRVERFTLWGSAANTAGVARFQYVTKGMDVSNLYVAVHDDATTCNGVEILDSWIGSFRNIWCWHGSENGVNGARSTGKGFWVHNIASDGVGGAINQLVVQNLHARYFGRGIQIGDTNAAPAESAFLNSIVFLGGATEFSEEWNVWIGSGVETLTFIGHHPENGGQAVDGVTYTVGGGVRIGNGALHTAFRGAKFFSNATSAIRHDLYLDAASGKVGTVTLDDVYISGIADTGISIEGSKDGNISNVRLRGVTFEPVNNNQGTAIGFASGAGRIRGFSFEDISLTNPVSGKSVGTFIADQHMLETTARHTTKENRTSAYTIAANERNYFGSNLGAAGTVTFTLPDHTTLRDSDMPFRVRFIKETDQTLSVDIPATATLVTPAGTTSATYRANAAGELGAYLELELINKSTGKWVAVNQTGTWAIV